jgi:hypothetical protein
MRHLPFRRGLLVACVVGLGLLSSCPAGYGAEKTTRLPPFAKVKAAVEKHFAAQPDYQPGDIISQSEVASLLSELANIGFVVPDRKDILDKVPGDDDFLVTNLRTTAGRKFMGRMSNCAAGYDRLERLAVLPHGQQTIIDLIRGPGGEDMVKYMTQTPGGKAMGRQLANAPGGEGFNDPTGRLYTAQALLTRLQRSYALARQKAAAGQ